MRVCVIGAAGNVGSAASAELARSHLVDEVWLVDRDVDRVRVRGMDLRLRAALLGGAEVRMAGLDEAPEADVLVLTAGVPHRDGASRLGMAEANAAVLDDVLSAVPRGWPGTAVIASNPVDPLCTLVARELRSATVLGYTLQDSLRLAEGIAEAVGERPNDVHAWAIGEHGPHMVPLFDRTLIRGRAVRLTRDQRERAVTHALRWYDTWQRCRTGLTSALSSAAGLAHVVARLAGTAPCVLPASAPLSGQYGLSGLSIGVPVRLHRGTAEVVEWPLTGRERAALHRSAEVVGEALRRCGAAP